MSEQTFDKPMMASEIIAALSDPKRNINDFHNHKYAHGTAQNVRVSLVQSKKFVIDDSLLYNLVQASMVRPKSFMKAIEIAKPPFPNMFIEFNEQALFKAYKKFYATRYPALVPFINERLLDLYNNKRKGYHIVEEEKGTNFVAWTRITDDAIQHLKKVNTNYEHMNLDMAELKAIADQGKWCVAPYGFRIAHVSDEQVNLSKRVQQMKEQTELFNDTYKARFERGEVDGSDQVTWPGVSFFGEDYFHYYSDRWAAGLDKRIKELSEMRRRNGGNDYVYGRNPLIGKGFNRSVAHRVVSQGDFASIVSKMYWTQTYAIGWILQEEQIKQKTYRLDEQEERRAMEITYSFIRGQAKFLVAALAMFNFDHVIFKKKQRETKKIKHVARGQAIPFNEYSLMTIELPKPRGVKRYEREFTGHGTPKCEHWRCGHWRRFRDRFGNVTRRIWINAKKVGNKAYGTKQTEYKLNKAQGE
jgi:hypothetical protein